MAERYLTLKQFKIRNNMPTVHPPGFSIRVQRKEEIPVKSKNFKAESRYVSPQVVRYSR